MNKGRGIKIKYLICLLLSATLLINGCAYVEEKKEEYSREYKVLVQNSDFFEAECNYATIKAGEAFSTELYFEAGYSYEGCNYEDCQVEKTDKGVRIKLESVEHDYRLIIRTNNGEKQTEYPAYSHTITYYANGGKWTGGAESLTEVYSLGYHFRANTSLGKELSRKGYTLIGWNTEADGSGEHVGLGSRTEAEKLYAEWCQWEDAGDFTYARVEDGIALTGYKGKGDAERLVIPAEIDGQTVVSIETSFSTNIPCDYISSKILILPESLRTIKKGAFKNAGFTDIYFYDSLAEVDDGAFSSPISGYHINAAVGPSYQTDNDNARFADKIDYLMLQQGKRLIVFGGCSASYGIHSEYLRDAFADYSVCNLGVIGGVNASFQYDIIGSYLREGDVFVSLPEEMSPYQLMKSNTMDYRMFIMIEGNYDLLALADMSYYATFWETFGVFAKEKQEIGEGSYEDSVISYNIYGDISYGRLYTEEKAWEKDVTLSDNTYLFDSELLTTEGIGRLCAYYKAFEEKGVRVFISYAPVNLNGIGDIAEAEAYEEKFCAMLALYGYAPIGKLKDHLFRGRYFFDSDYHLNDYGAILQTKALISELKNSF